MSIALELRSNGGALTLDLNPTSAGFVQTPMVFMMAQSGGLM